MGSPFSCLAWVMSVVVSATGHDNGHAGNWASQTMGFAGKVASSVYHGKRYVRFAVELPVTASAAAWATVVGHANCAHWNNERAMIVCTGSSPLGGAFKGDTTWGSLFDTSQNAPDFRTMRHESKHANQWLIPGFPVLYLIFRRTFETQAGPRDGCYQPDPGGYRAECGK